MKVRIGIMVLAFSASAFAADLAVLRNGFSIRHERREQFGALTRLYLSADGSNYADVATAQIDHFEKDLSVPFSAASPAVEPSAESPVDVRDAITASSLRHRIDPDLISSVIHAESGFNPQAVSRKGAQGLMQLMPETASLLGVKDAFDPRANVEGGTKYLHELLVRYDFDMIKALAAYNAGPHRVEQYGGVPPFRETRAYVRRIVLDFNRKKLEQRKNTAKRSRSTKTASQSVQPASSKSK